MYRGRVRVAQHDSFATARARGANRSVLPATAARGALDRHSGQAALERPISQYARDGTDRSEIELHALASLATRPDRLAATRR